ncbi:salicylic acid-binding protein 2-like [Manihot esculenta]|uniref:salicylic acid-binding protein 2-like n=1 Tax=Manihot esculenta TaxID=3983 RepID=UPI000B5D1626|nr:salicylic acid-binding protein 2-like [Manihot esculenta]
MTSVRPSSIFLHDLSNANKAISEEFQLWMIPNSAVEEALEIEGSGHMPMDKARTPSEAWLDNEFLPYSSSLRHPTSLFFGLKLISSKLYQLSHIEDLELSMTSVGPSSIFLHDLSNANKAIFEEFQLRMIPNSAVEKALEIEGSDHML